MLEDNQDIKEKQRCPKGNTNESDVQKNGV